MTDEEKEIIATIRNMALMLDIENPILYMSSRLAEDCVKRFGEGWDKRLFGNDIKIVVTSGKM